jgi:hypothetical protein
MRLKAAEDPQKISRTPERVRSAKISEAFFALCFMRKTAPLCFRTPERVRSAEMKFQHLQKTLRLFLHSGKTVNRYYDFGREEGSNYDSFFTRTGFLRMDKAAG